jgi:hypothetical protein
MLELFHLSLHQLANFERCFFTGDFGVQLMIYRYAVSNINKPKIQKGIIINF